jgi:probable rRNA maturation factor
MARKALKRRAASKTRVASKTCATSKPRTAPDRRAVSEGNARVTLDIRIESDLWRRKRGIRALARRALIAAASVAARSACELAVLLTDDPGIRVINADWRGVDAPTNVLSFPAARGGSPPFLGDIALAYETIAAEATAEGKPFAHHFAHLCVHGFLHLLGYDHIRRKDAEVMEAAERDILQRLRIPNPYG